MAKYQINQIVSYMNGSPAVYTGMIKSVRPSGHSFAYVIIDHTNKADVILWNAGYAIGSDIQESQIIS